MEQEQQALQQVIVPVWRHVPCSVLLCIYVVIRVWTPANHQAAAASPTAAANRPIQLLAAWLRGCA